MIDMGLAQRTYGIGALLLDLDDPTAIIGQLPRPALSPTKREQDGDVPNVVYSCGSLMHHSDLFIPYGIADRRLRSGEPRHVEMRVARESKRKGVVN